MAMYLLGMSIYMASKTKKLDELPGELRSISKHRSMRNEP